MERPLRLAVDLSSKRCDESSKRVSMPTRSRSPMSLIVSQMRSASDLTSISMPSWTPSMRTCRVTVVLTTTKRKKRWKGKRQGC